MVKVNEWLWEEDAEIERLEQEQMALRRIRIRNSKWDIRKLWIGSDHRTMALMLGLFAFSGYLYDPMMSGNLIGMSVRFLDGTKNIFGRRFCIYFCNRPH